MDQNAELVLLLGELKGGMEALLRSQEQQTKRITCIDKKLDEKVTQLDNRVDELEDTVKGVKGFALGVSAVVGLLAGKLGTFASYFAGVLGS